MCLDILPSLYQELADVQLAQLDNSISQHQTHNLAHANELLQSVISSVQDWYLTYSSIYTGE